MTLSQLKYVVAVDTHRNFRKAAEYCCVTQPTLSMQIQKLEEELNLVLFDRQTSPIQPTDIGRKVIEQAKIILEETERMQDIISNFRQGIFGRLRVGIIPTVAPYLLPLFLHRFIQKYPEVDLTIDELQTQPIVQQLAQREIDVGIIASPLNNPRFIEKPLYLEPFVAYVGRQHRLAKRQRIHVAELSLSDLWLLKEGHCFRDQILHLCKSTMEQQNDKPIHLHFEGENLETLLNLVDKNIGMTLLPYLATLNLKKQSRSTAGIIKEFVPPIPTRKISLIYPRSELKKQLIEVLEAEITAAIPQGLQELQNHFVVQ